MVLIDDACMVLARASEPTPRQTDGIGPCCDPAEVVALVEALIVRAAAQARLDVPLSAICVAGIGEDGVHVDAFGRSFGLAIPWFDERARGDADLLFDVARSFETQTGIRIDAARTAAKWHWLSRQRNAPPAGATWVALTDYPAFVWTGTPFMSETLAARTGCYDCLERRWIPTLLDAAHAPALPPVVAAGSVVGMMLAGPLCDAGVADGGTAVIAGGHDHPVAASVVLSINAEAMLDSMGTAELVYAETPYLLQRSATQAHAYIAFSVPVRAGMGTACLGVFPLSAVLEPWMNEGTARAAVVRAVVGGAPIHGEPGAAGLRFVPLDAHVDDTLLDAHASENAARAILEGCAMYTRRMIEAIRALGVPLGPIFTTGGWTRSASLLKLRADVLGTPLQVLDEPQLTALGAALIGARAVASDLNAHVARVAQHTVPNDERLTSHYRELYAEYSALFDRRIEPPASNSRLAETS